MSTHNITNIHNITLNSPLKYIISEDDTLDVMIIKAYFALQILKIIIFGMKAFSLYVIYHLVLRSGFKNIPDIKYVQFFVALVALEMAKYVIYDSSSESR